MKRKFAALLAFVLVLCTCMNAMAASYSVKWTQSADQTWQAYKYGVKLTNTWVMDDECDVKEGLYYLVDENGNLVTSQLVLDGEGHYYSFNDVHDGHFGAMRTANGVYNGVNLVFEQTHNGGYGSILNADGIAALAAKYGVKEMSNIKNSAVVVLSEVKKDSSDSGDVPTTYYTVKYQMNGYGATPSDARVAAGGKLTAPATPVDETGKMDFSAWYKDSELATAWNFAKDTVTSDVTLFAKWVIAEIKVTQITLNKTALTLAVDGSETLTATVSPADAANKILTWSSSDAAVATVDQTGAVTAVSEGTAVITATATDGSGKKAECTVTVSNTPPLPTVIKVTGITLNKTELNLEIGGSETLTATVAPADATNKILTWSSSNAAVATVDQTGAVTAVSEGTAVITATATDGSGKKAECTVTVEAPEPEVLKFTAKVAGSTISFTWAEGEDVETSTDDGENWNTYDKGTTLTLVNVNDSVCFRGNGVITADDDHFIMDGEIEASGDVTSLTNGVGGDATLTESCYSRMFYECESLTKAPVLPSTTLAESCYSDMFSGCTSLSQAPALPSTTLAASCYAGMFFECEGLTEAPDLPATTLAESCYLEMFEDCTNLTTVPTFSAVNLAAYCCDCMFSGCLSLTTVPALSANILEESCYNMMFEGCESLATAPAILATVMAESSCSCMFRFCTSLVTPPVLSATTLAGNCYLQMFEGCESLQVNEEGLGTKFFECPSSIAGTEGAYAEDMFKDTIGGIGDPTAGTSYYYQIDN